MSSDELSDLGFNYPRAIYYRAADTIDYKHLASELAEALTYCYGRSCAGAKCSTSIIGDALAKYNNAVKE